MKKKERSTYGVPLYGAVWPPGDYVIFGGGGGKASSGIVNKLSVAQSTKGVLSEEVAMLKFENNTPLRMCLTASGREVLVALAAGGICLVRLSQASAHPYPVLTLDQEGPAAQRLGAVAMVKALSFSLDGRLLALGLEDGGLQVWDWPTARLLSSVESGKEAARDVDFSLGHNNQVLAVTCEDSTCSLWDWERGLFISRLELPPDIKRGSFGRVRWARDGSLGLYASLTVSGEGHVLYYEQDDVGEVMCLRKMRVDPNPITALDISPSGLLLGFGTSEGDVTVLATGNLRPVSRVRGAHLVFVTAVTFSSDSSALLSVSGMPALG